MPKITPTAAIAQTLIAINSCYNIRNAVRKSPARKNQRPKQRAKNLIWQILAADSDQMTAVGNRILPRTARELPERPTRAPTTDAKEKGFKKLPVAGTRSSLTIVPMLPRKQQHEKLKGSVPRSGHGNGLIVARASAQVQAPAPSSARQVPLPEPAPPAASSPQPVPVDI